MRVEFHQILFWVIVDSVSAQGSYGPRSNPPITLSKILLMAPKAGIVIYLGDLIERRHHHVRSSRSKGIRSCRRFLNPYSEELKTNLSIRLSRAENVAVDDQLQSFIVDVHSLVAISEVRCRLGDAPAGRRPQDVLPDQIINQDPPTFVTFDDIIEHNAVPSVKSGRSRYSANVMT